MEGRSYVYRVGTSNCRPHIFMIYSILLFRFHKCNILLDSYKNKVITSVEFDTMKRIYAELSKILFTEAEVRCAMVMALVHNNGEGEQQNHRQHAWGRHENHPAYL